MDSPEDFMEDAGVASLQETQKIYCDRRIEEDELGDALKKLNKGKAPGLDGLTPEFYQTFWEELKHPFRKMVEEGLAKEKLPLSTTTAVLTLIRKGTDTNQKLIENWRPMSLLNTDYKVIAKTLSRRIATVMEKIISPEQSYCVPGRSIYDSLWLTRDIIRWRDENNEPLAVLKLDQCQAFNKINHDYLLATLRKMGFGENFIGAIKTLYYGAKCHVKVGDSLTAPIQVKRGIRQGCPLSGQLYAVSIEPLLRSLKKHLMGIELPGLPPMKVGRLRLTPTTSLSSRPKKAILKNWKTVFIDTEKYPAQR